MTDDLGVVANWSVVLDVFAAINAVFAHHFDRERGKSQGFGVLKFGLEWTRAFAAGFYHPVGGLPISPISGCVGEADQPELNLFVAAISELGIGGENTENMVRVFDRDLEQSVVPAFVEGGRRLEKMPRAIHLVHRIEVPPLKGWMVELEIGIEVAVGLLCFRDRVDRAVDS